MPGTTFRREFTPAGRIRLAGETHVQGEQMQNSMKNAAAICYI